MQEKIKQFKDKAMEEKIDLKALSPRTTKYLMLQIDADLNKYYEKHAKHVSPKQKQKRMRTTSKESMTSIRAHEE